MGSLFKAIRKFGYFDGIKLFTSLKLGNGQIKLPPDGYEVYIRNTVSDRFTFKETFLTGQYEIGEIPRPQFIIDAGANIGISTLFFAINYPESKIFAIEPDPGNFELLKKNTQRFGNVKAFNGGVWYKTAQLEIIDNKKGPRDFATVEVEGSPSDTVSAITISDIVKKENFQTIDVLKLDIEGSEKELFSQNYEDWLPFTKTLIIELHDRMRPGCSKSFFSALSKYNFSLYRIIDENLVFTNDDYIEPPKVGTYLIN